MIKKLYDKCVAWAGYKYAKQILSLPIYPSLGEAEISYIVASIKSFFAK